MDIISALLTTDSSGNGGSSGSGPVTYILLGVILVAIVVMFIFTSRKNKKKEQEQKAMLDAVAPGNKVTTIGGISGIVVEVNPADDTFVLETGSEDSGKSYIKFVKQAIYQTDAKPAVAEKNGKDEAKAETAEKAEEPAKEEPAKEEPAEETKAEETKAEETETSEEK